MMFDKLILALSISTVSALVQAQAYPVKPITVIVPFAAGGPGDALMRSFAQVLGKQLKQSLLIENAGGASGNVGAARAARATPDGYTLLYHNIGFATAPGLYKKLDFNPFTDYDYIGMMSTSPNILVGRSDLPAANLKELVAFIKTNQTKVTIADAGVGGPAGLCSILLASQPVPRELSIPAGLQGYVKSEVEKWTSLLRAAGAPQE
jgi:tripartite-type tricarboxylate transporter receptor subunit TctC